jgi:putative Flp pilus-assembly TadE/G-like protein
MKLHGRRSLRKHEQGQTFIPIIVMIGLFLLAILGVAMDYSQIWAHRQMAQAAADAACQAGAADLYLEAVDPSISGAGGLTDFGFIGTDFDCSTKPNTPPCQYASFNGYTGKNVKIAFPASLPGVAPLPPALTTPFPYIQATVSDAVPMSFTRLVSSNPSVTISAKASCGVNPVSMPTPLVILHQTASASLSVSGSGKIIVLGGPQRSIQVNSSSSGAVNVGIVDLSQGGPNNTGSDLAVFGGPSAKPSDVSIGTTGHYLPHSIPLGDPFAVISAPARPTTPGTAMPVPFGFNGCPDPNGCVEFTAGDYSGCLVSGSLSPPAQGCLMLPYTGSNPGFSSGAAAWIAGRTYAAGTLMQPTSGQHNSGGYLFIATNTGTSGTTSPNPWNQTICTRQPDGSCSGGAQVDGGITWRNVGVVVLNKLNTGIFDPGLYFVAANGLSLGNNSTARVSTASGDGSNGVMFYFSTSATVSVTSNSGKAPACTSASSGSGSPNACIVSYKIDGTVSSAATQYVSSRPLQCPSGSANPPQVLSVLDGNILLAPCSGTYASPDGNRGFLFFQNRSVSANPSWGGGGQFLSSGFLYFHTGSGATCGTNTSCLTLQGGSSSQSYALGNIVVDELALGGNPQINMILNPTATFEVLKPTLLQ